MNQICFARDFPEMEIAESRLSSKIRAYVLLFIMFHCSIAAGQLAGGNAVSFQKETGKSAGIFRSDTQTMI